MMKIRFDRVEGDGEPRNCYKAESEISEKLSPQLEKHLLEVFTMRDRNGIEIKNIATGIVQLAEIGLKYLNSRGSQE